MFIVLWVSLYNLLTYVFKCIYYFIYYYFLGLIYHLVGNRHKIKHWLIDTWYNLSCLLQTCCHLSTNETLSVSWQLLFYIYIFFFILAYGLISYGSGWRKDVENPCLEFETRFGYSCTMFLTPSVRPLRTRYVYSCTQFHNTLIPRPFPFGFLPYFQWLIYKTNVRK